MGFAKLDTDRKKRSGFAEVIYCQGKSDEFIGQIFRKLYEVEGEVFGTRASPHQYEIVKRFLPEISYDPVSHILKLEKDLEEIDTLRKIDVFDFDHIHNEYLLEDIRKYGKQIY